MPVTFKQAPPKKVVEAVKHVEAALEKVQDAMKVDYQQDDLERDVLDLEAIQAQINEIDAQIFDLKEKEKALVLASVPIEGRVVAAIVPRNSAPETKFEEMVAGRLVTIGARRSKRIITDIQKIATFLGDTFWSLASVKIGDIDKYLTFSQRNEVLKTTHEDRRGVVVHSKTD